MIPQCATGSEVVAWEQVRQRSAVKVGVFVQAVRESRSNILLVLHARLLLILLVITGTSTPPAGWAAVDRG